MKDETVRSARQMPRATNGLRRSLASGMEGLDGRLKDVGRTAGGLSEEDDGIMPGPADTHEVSFGQFT
jgi:hypothetical protein